GFARRRAASAAEYVFHIDLRIFAIGELYVQPRLEALRELRIVHRPRPDAFGFRHDLRARHIGEGCRGHSALDQVRRKRNWQAVARLMPALRLELAIPRLGNQQRCTARNLAEDPFDGHPRYLLQRAFERFNERVDVVAAGVEFESCLPQMPYVA